MRTGHPFIHRALAVCFVAALSYSAPAVAATFVVPEDSVLIKRADAIIIGSALTSYTQIASYGGIETVTPISVQEVVKGDVGGDIINVHTAGGRLGKRVKIVSGTVQFVDGDRVLLFLKKTPQGTWAVHNQVLGKFDFETDRGGRKVLVRQEGDIAGWHADGTPFRDKNRRADRFLQYVREVARGGEPKQDYYASNSQLRTGADSLRTETAAASNSAMSYTFDYPGYGFRWNVFPSGVTFYTYNTAVNPTRAANAVTNAAASWNNDTGSNVNLVNGGADPGPGTPNGVVFAPDGRNSVVWETDLAAMGHSGFSCTTNSYGGLLGLGGINEIGSGHTHAGELFWAIIEGDVDMNLNVLGCDLLSNLNNLVGAVAHEVGHAIGFRHSDQNRAGNAACSPSASFECSGSAIMTSNIPNGLNGALQEYDINAVRAVYPGPVCTAASITTHPQSTTIAQGGNTTLTVGATGTATLNYQWYNASSPNETNPVGTNSSSLNVSPASTTSYWVKVTNACGTQSSNTATVTVSAPCTYSLTPTSSTVNAAGGSRTLNINTQPGCAWTAVSNFAFLTVTSAGSGNGPATVTYSVAPNNTGSQRQGTLTVAGSTFSVTQAPVLAVKADFGGDGRADLLWRNTSSDQNLIWFMNGGANTGKEFLPATGNANMNVEYVGDFNGDKKADVLWRNVANGHIIVWTMDGSAVIGANVLSTVASLNTQIAGVADFNGDGRDDIVWRNYNNGNNQVWLMSASGLTIQGTLILEAIPNTNVRIEYVGDFNGDRLGDVLLRNFDTGHITMWLLNGATNIGTKILTTVANPLTEIGGVGDFDGDTKTDIIWRNYSNGNNQIWFMDGTFLRNAFPFMPVADTNVRIIGVSDFDGSGKADIVWRNFSPDGPNRGLNSIWFMDGTTFLGGSGLETVTDFAWEIVAPR